MIFDTDKPLSDNIPFFGVHRLEAGTVIACLKDPDKPCAKCIFFKCCFCRHEKVVIDYDERKDFLKEGGDL